MFSFIYRKRNWPNWNDKDFVKRLKCWRAYSTPTSSGSTTTGTSKRRPVSRARSTSSWSPSSWPQGPSRHIWRGSKRSNKASWNLGAVKFSKDCIFSIPVHLPWFIEISNVTIFSSQVSNFFYDFSTIFEDFPLKMIPNYRPNWIRQDWRPRSGYLEKQVLRQVCHWHSGVHGSWDVRRTLWRSRWRLCLWHVYAWDEHIRVSLCWMHGPGSNLQKSHQWHSSSMFRYQFFLFGNFFSY